MAPAKAVSATSAARKADDIFIDKIPPEVERQASRCRSSRAVASVADRRDWQSAIHVSPAERMVGYGFPPSLFELRRTGRLTHPTGFIGRMDRLIAPSGLSWPCSDLRGARMLTLYSYPTLFGVADNNGYGLKVFAFLRLAGVPFRHEHIFDASKAPRGQLALYRRRRRHGRRQRDHHRAIVTAKYRLTIDAALTPAQRDHRPADHAHARRPLLGDVVFALEGRALLAGVPRRAAARASEPDRRRPCEGAGVQRQALPLPGHRPLRSRCRDGARARRSRRARRT